MSHQIRIDDTEVVFACNDGETVLDAAARGGIELPYSCRKGVCGNCKGKLVSGTLVPGTGGGSHDAGILADDEHLFCSARAASDLVIQPRSWHNLDPDARKTLPVKVFRITQPAEDVSVLQLRFAAGVRVKFRAGQYLQILLPDGERRSFSMANAPHDSDGVQLHIRHVPGGHFSRGILPTLKAGDVLQVELPHGDFWLREDSERPMLMVAGGTGFAPIKSIVDHMVRKKIQRPITLYWGSRSPGGLYAEDAVRRWQQQLPQFSYHHVVSEAQSDGGWAGQTGLVHDAVLASGLDLSGWEVYACGAPPMVTALRQACCGVMGLPPEQFFSDAFVPSQAG